MADFVFDHSNENAPFPGSAVSHGDVIFVFSDFLSKFFQQIRPGIQAPYVLVSCHGDASAPNDDFFFNPPMKLDDKLDTDTFLLAWFAMNPSVVHPKLVPIPIGITNTPLGGPTKSQDFFNFVPKAPPFLSPKRDILLFGGNLGESHPSRSGIAAGLSWAHFSGRTNHTEFLSLLARSKFILSPRGGGPDTRRTWEALLMGCIPIVPRIAPMLPLYVGVPHIAVDDFIKDVNQTLLLNFTLPDSLDMSVLWARNFIAKILSFKSKS